MSITEFLIIMAALFKPILIPLGSLVKDEHKWEPDQRDLDKDKTTDGRTAGGAENLYDPANTTLACQCSQMGSPGKQRKCPSETAITESTYQEGLLKPGERKQEVQLG